jgi:hypothetical protein
LGGSCAATSDCCVGTCNQGVCTCSAAGQPCNERMDCCSTVCTAAQTCL